MANMLPPPGGVLAQLAQDVRYGLRLLRKSPGFTVVTVLTLAIGIGASTALFSVVDGLLIRPFPYPDSERLVVVWSRPARGGIANVSPAKFLDFRDQNRVFDHMGAGSQAVFNVSIQGDPGFRPENVLTMRLTMPEARYAEATQVRAFDRALLERVKALPGVRAATLAYAMPLEGLAIPMRFQLASQPAPVAERPRASFHCFSEGYFETLGVRLRKGRLFTERDNESAPRVAIVNEAFVERYLGKEEPLGQRLLMQCARPGGVLAVRTQAEPAGMVRAIRAVASFAQPRSQAWIVGSFAVVALILAALGIYGVVSYAVAQSTRELGIRMALDARPGDLLRMTLGQAMPIVMIGLGLGLAGSFALTRVVESLLYQVKPTDPPTYLAVSALLMAVALLATYIPARRASRVDPLVALRWE